MKTAKIFYSGRSQAVRLPQEFRFKNEKEVKISKIGNTIVLTPIEGSWTNFFESLNSFTPDCCEERQQPQAEHREGMF